MTRLIIFFLTVSVFAYIIYTRDEKSEQVFTGWQPSVITVEELPAIREENE